MSEIYKVDSLTAALTLAKKFESEGKYNLFRGQAQNWQVIPTAGRLSKKKFAKAKEQLERLYYYFITESSLKKFRKEIDSFFAIAQHYGIPTNYIDFTTDIDVAFYFATNSKLNKPQQNCAIICLNEEDFIDFAKITKVLYENGKVHPPYISRIDVENLWRLQAQSGCFLFTPYHEIEYFYNFDRIIFPFTEPFEELKKGNIYPERKSELEILIDHYFDTERRIEGEERLRKFAQKLNIPIEHLPAQNLLKIFKKRQPHKSWTSPLYKKWNFQLKENWRGLENTEKVEVKFPLRLNQKKLIKHLKDETEKQFSIKNIKRNTPIDFEVIAKPKLPRNLSVRINRSCQRIWDGTRNLPYSNNEIITIISTYIFLEVQKSKYNQIDTDYLDNELITLNLTNKYGSRTRCKATPQNIVLAFRDDIEDLISDTMSRPIPSELLLHTNKISYVFDFEKLLNLFITEMIAYQVLDNSENENPVIFYTPAQIKTLAYA